MLKIIDCFIFYNELDLLTYRLNLLNNIVDYFVIVESTHTFVGREKKLIFQENKHLFEHFLHKIVHIVVEDFPHKYPNVRIDDEDAWKNEFFQRNAISRGIKELQNLLLDEDVLIIADLDEIPDPSTLSKIKQGEIKVGLNTLEMDLYYYNLNHRFYYKWFLSKVISYQTYKNVNMTCNDIRKTNCQPIPHGGWHLSYFGDKHFIQNKIENFSHQELNKAEYTDLDKIEERTKNSKDLYDRHIDFENIKIENNTYLPVHYQKYLNNYYK